MPDSVKSNAVNNSIRFTSIPLTKLTKKQLIELFTGRVATPLSPESLYHNTLRAAFEQIAAFVSALVPTMNSEDRIAVYRGMAVLRRLIDEEIAKRKKIN